MAPEPEDLSADLDALVAAPDVDHAWGAFRRRLARRRAARVSAVAVVVALGIGGSLVVLDDDEPDGIVTTPPSEETTTSTSVAAPTTTMDTVITVPSPTDAPTATMTPAPVLSLGAPREIGDGPLQQRRSAATAWNGTDLFIWGGNEVTGMPVWTAAGAIYNALADVWRGFAPAPRALAAPQAWWIGNDVVVIGDDGALAWNVDRDEWRELAAPPRSLGRAIAVGSKIFAPVSGLQYDVASNSWSEIAPLPEHDEFTWVDVESTGREVIVFALPSVWRYESSSNRWVSLPDSGLTYGAGATIGDRLLATDGISLRVLPALDAAEWVDAPFADLRDSECGGDLHVENGVVWYVDCRNQVMSAVGDTYTWVRAADVPRDTSRSVGADRFFVGSDRLVGYGGLSDVFALLEPDIFMIPFSSRP
ncbi:MAG: hypothetical protein SGJ13_18635 [Actinomycetota bacterium]|nr:hypothetical protein [Actinomycetota bacterium]